MFKIINSTPLCTSKIFRVVRNELSSGDGTVMTRDVVIHPGAVVIVPKSNRGTLFLVRQYRHAIDKIILEFPAGTLEAGEEPLQCAIRECQEEVGQLARDWVSIGTLYPAPGFCSEIQHCYVARELEPSPLPKDQDEILDPEELTISEVEEAILAGAICDAKTIAVFTRAQMMKLI